MEQEITNEVTESSEQKTGGQSLDLDTVIQQQIEGKEEEGDSASADAGDASEETGEPEQAPAEPEAQESDQPEEKQEADDEPAWFERRLGKEVRRRKEATEEADAIRQENDDLKKDIEALRKQLESAETQSVPQTANPLDSVDTIEALGQERRMSHNRLDFADQVEDLLDEGDIDGALKQLEAQDIKFDADRDSYGWEEEAAKDARRFLKKVRTHARKSLDQHIPERGQFLQQQKQFNAEAKRLYPELANQESEFAKLFAEVRNGPAGTFFQAMPDGAWQMARWVRGYMAEQGDSKKSSGPAKTPPAPVPKPSSAPATGNADEAKYKAARDQVFEKADSDSLDNYLGTLLQS